MNNPNLEIKGVGNIIEILKEQLQWVEQLITLMRSNYHVSLNEMVVMVDTPATRAALAGEANEIRNLLCGLVEPEYLPAHMLEEIRERTRCVIQSIKHPNRLDLEDIA